MDFTAFSLATLSRDEELRAQNLEKDAQAIMDVAHEAGIDFSTSPTATAEPGETEPLSGGFYRAVCGRLPADKAESALNLREADDGACCRDRGCGQARAGLRR